MCNLEFESFQLMKNSRQYNSSEKNPKLSFFCLEILTFSFLQSSIKYRGDLSKKLKKKSRGNWESRDGTDNLDDCTDFPIKKKNSFSDLNFTSSILQSIRKIYLWDTLGVWVCLAGLFHENCLLPPLVAIASQKDGTNLSCLAKEVLKMFWQL